MTTVEFGDAGLVHCGAYNPNGRVFGQMSVRTDGRNRTVLTAEGDRGFGVALEIPQNYGDLVATAILKEFVPQAAGWVGLTKDAPPYMVVDKLLESSRANDRTLGELIRLALSYERPPEDYTSLSTV